MLESQTESEAPQKETVDGMLTSEVFRMRDSETTTSRLGDGVATGLDTWDAADDDAVWLRPVDRGLRTAERETGGRPGGTTKTR